MSKITDQAEALAQQRALLIIQVRAGQITARAAAAQLRVSRKTYYEWERRALQSMMGALRDRPGGRPPTPATPRQETMQQQTEALKQQVQELQQSLAIRQALTELHHAKKKALSRRP